MAFRILLAALAAAAVARVMQIYRRFEVAENSMEPHLSAGDYLITSRRVDGIGLDDIIVFEHPEHSEFCLVKRVVGVTGDTITIADGVVSRNGTVISNATPGAGEWTVGPGEVFVLGDNRAASSGDSRMLGPIPIGLVEGPVVGRYWPPRGIGRI